VEDFYNKVVLVFHKAMSVFYEAANIFYYVMLFYK